ncbi:winged helix-turn-helix domain-containing protein [Dokdonella koreensis]|uniref:Tetratricopeptide repeat domain protein n=1 Tax=Dokdonella koreensis DS-123 TaxID=1300342 RepID=A0A161HJP1_9GAMM|nr:winged helix-turn-helix domain-containing protein [Dokdonella koreensis]ANB17286.1 Tetratricopeptide repeat domain protein [Dokdonella koreensis DS-123]
MTPSPAAVRRYRLDDLVVDLDRQRVERDGTALDVAGLSFRLLEFLIGQGDRVVSFDGLMAGVWAPAVVNEETVTQRIKLLRQALGDDGRKPRYVRSVRGVGYQLCVAVQPLAEPEQALAGPQADVERRPPVRRWRGVALAAGVLGLAAAAAAFLAGRPATPPADDALARARHYAGIGQRDNNERAIALFEDVLAATPDNREAQIGLSLALSARICLYNVPPDPAQRAEALARAVLARDADDAAATAALAYADDCRGRIDAALAGYERAHALDPAGRKDSLASAAHLLAVKGRLADALRANLAVGDQGAKLRFLDIQIARNLELLGFTAVAEQRYARSFRLYPDNVFANVAYPRSLFLQGRFAEAQAALDEALQRPLHPDLFLLAGELALLRGEPAQAHAAFARASQLRPHASLPDTLAHCYAVPPADAVWRAAKREAIRAAIADGDRWPESQIEIVLLDLAAGDTAAALDALEAAIAAGFSDRAYLQTSPLMRALAGEPRFAAAIDTIGRHVAAERTRVLAADWLPPDLLSALPAPGRPERTPPP